MTDGRLTINELAAMTSDALNTLTAELRDVQAELSKLRAEQELADVRLAHVPYRVELYELEERLKNHPCVFEKEQPDPRLF